MIEQPPRLEQLAPVEQLTAAPVRTRSRSKAS
jgi:hypothetical protein